MNFSKKLSGAARKAVFALAIVSSFTLAISAQHVEPQSQGKMYGEPGFRGEPINLNVVNADIRDILSYITDQYGINFVIDKSVKDVPVTVKVNDVPWNIALDSVLQSQELGVQVNGNILRIADNKVLATEGEFNRAKENAALDMTPLYTEMIRLNYASVAGDTGTSAPTSGTSVNLMDSGPSASQAGTGQGMGMQGNQVGGLLPIIKRRLSRRGSIEIDTRSNSLIITDVASNLAAVKQLVNILDQPEPQVEIEARIVVATRSFSRDVGVQLFAALSGARGSTIAGGTVAPNATTTGGAGGGTTTVPSALNGLGVGPGLPTQVANGNLLSSIPNTVIGLTTGIFGTATLSALISAGEQKGEAKVIATPRVSVQNNKTAEIKSGSKIPVTTIQPGAAAGGAVVATTTYVDVPLRLNIKPRITDQGTVILEVTGENASTSTIVGGVAPAINSQSIQTTVVVPDGGTTVVGGVLFDDERNSQDRTPGLASVPLLGNLFKRKGVQRNTNEILFFITPRIFKPDYANGQVPVRSEKILQPVPMGNPPSNSTPAVDQPVVLAAPALTRPEPAATPAPGKPSGN